jgi:hypothetical protein
MLPVILIAVLLFPALLTAADARIVVDRLGKDWQAQQVQEPCILPNSKAPGRLVILYSGVSPSNKAVARFGKAWADEASPLTWNEDKSNPFFGPSKSGWDSGSIRLDCFLYIPEEDSYYIYYSGTAAKIQDRVGLAICPAGSDGYASLVAENVVRYGDKPILAPEPAAPFFETMASQAAVFREWNATTSSWDWYMYYSYRGKNGILPGIRLATSSDGKTWTRHFNPDDPRGMGHVFDSTPGAYYEWHQVFKKDDTYILCIEVGPQAGQRWRPVLAVSKHPTKGWTQLSPDTILQTEWTLYRDDAFYHVATPALYQIRGQWYLYIQACAQPGTGNYIDGRWDMWGIPCTQLLPTLPGHTSIFVPPSKPVR